MSGWFAEDLSLYHNDSVDNSVMDESLNPVRNPYCRDVVDIDDFEVIYIEIPKRDVKPSEDK